MDALERLGYTKTKYNGYTEYIKDDNIITFYINGTIGFQTTANDWCTLDSEDVIAIYDIINKSDK